MNPKVHPNGRVRGHYQFRPDVHELLQAISERDCRPMVDELTWLIQRRATELDIPGKVGE